MEKLIIEKELQLSTTATTSTIVTATPSISRVAVSTVETYPTGSHSAEKLSKPMGDFSLKDIEIEKLKTLLKKVQNDKIRANNTYLVEVQKNFRLTRQIEK